MPIQFCDAALAPICVLHYQQFAGSNSLRIKLPARSAGFDLTVAYFSTSDRKPAVRRCFELFSSALTLYKQISAHKFLRSESPHQIPSQLECSAGFDLPSLIFSSSVRLRELLGVVSDCSSQLRIYSTLWSLRPCILVFLALCFGFTPRGWLRPLSSP